MVASRFRRGFKKEAGELALEVRREMRLRLSDRLDPRALAAHLGIPVFELDELVMLGMKRASVEQLMKHGRSEFSAAMFEMGGRRLIVANPTHSAGRQASNIVHEISHVLLEHEPPDQLIVAGCRRWDEVMEGEADWLAGELLVPRDAALELARREADVRASAARYGVSEAMMQWRLNHSGARKQAARERARRHRR